RLNVLLTLFSDSSKASEKAFTRLDLYPEDEDYINWDFSAQNYMQWVLFFDLVSEIYPDSYERDTWLQYYQQSSLDDLAPLFDSAYEYILEDPAGYLNSIDSMPLPLRERMIKLLALTSNTYTDKDYYGALVAKINDPSVIKPQSSQSPEEPSYRIVVEWEEVLPEAPDLSPSPDTSLPTEIRISAETQAMFFHYYSGLEPLQWSEASIIAYAEVFKPSSVVKNDIVKNAAIYYWLAGQPEQGEKVLKAELENFPLQINIKKGDFTFYAAYLILTDSPQVQELPEDLVQAFSQISAEGVINFTELLKVLEAWTANQESVASVEQDLYARIESQFLKKGFPKFFHSAFYTSWAESLRSRGQYEEAWEKSQIADQRYQEWLSEEEVPRPTWTSFDLALKLNKKDFLDQHYPNYLSGLQRSIGSDHQRSSFWTELRELREYHKKFGNDQTPVLSLEGVNPTQALTVLLSTMNYPRSYAEAQTYLRSFRSFEAYVGFKYRQSPLESQVSAAISAESGKVEEARKIYEELIFDRPLRRESLAELDPVYISLYTLLKSQGDLLAAKKLRRQYLQANPGYLVELLSEESKI
ncbi:MAG: hypothetical protein KDK66_03270, partial [Deltaproteobacteria bacterium]|nr:hypothetical protein [Deltaproteobacteria bacterium]